MSNDLTWITSFSDKELQSPFVIKKDSDYYKDLRQRLTHFVNCLRNVADEKSVSIAKNYSDRVWFAVSGVVKHQGYEAAKDYALNAPFCI